MNRAPPTVTHAEALTISDREVLRIDRMPDEVIDAPPVGTVTLVAATGRRIEGVAIADAITLLRGLA